MKIIITENYEEMSSVAANILMAKMMEDRKINLSITSGATPVGTYEILSKWYVKHKIDLTNVHFYNFDEIELNGKEEGITISALRKQFYLSAQVDEKQITKLTYDNYDRYENIIKESGGLDCMLIGLGDDGHFCGNMPIATDFSKYCYKIFLKKEYPWCQGLETSFPNNEAPEYFVTLGLPALLKVRHLVLIVSGNSKAEAVKKMFDSDITNEFPASALKLHPNLTLILDKEAAALLPK